jgi:hypothetical protein
LQRIVLPFATTLQVGVASPHWPVIAIGESTTKVPFTGRLPAATVADAFLPLTENLSVPGAFFLDAILIFVIPWTPAGFENVQRVPVLFAFHPVPPGIVTSSTSVPVESVSSTRTPFVDGSIVGVVGTAMVPLKRTPSLPLGVSCFVSLSFVLLANTGTTFVHGSQASPRASASPLACVGFGVVTQLSFGSVTPSPSVSLPVCGQSGPVPEQNAPWALPHEVVDGSNASVGQASPLPSQVSATSQTPAAERQTAVLFASVGHAALAPSQDSATSHAPAAERQTVLDDATPSAGQAVPDPSHVSATSQSPAAERQTVPEGES